MQGLKTVGKQHGDGRMTNDRAEWIVDFTCVGKRTLNTENVDRLERPVCRALEGPEQCSLLQMVIDFTVYSVDDL
jgi:hypothetical protein